MKPFTYIPSAFLLAFALLLAGCNDTPTAPDELMDISGTYQWSEITRIELHESLLTEFFGLQPEGTMNVLTCPTWGSLTITQVGSAFTGQGSQSAVCTTDGGQLVVPPVFPPSFPLVEGIVDDHRFRFKTDTGMFPCPREGTIQFDDGSLRLMGAGHCETPFPPEMSRDTILHFVAIRL